MRRFVVVTRLIQREPVAFQGCVQATLAALVGFGLIHWDSEQIGLMLAVIAAFLALFTRMQVTPTSKAPSTEGNHAEAGDPRVEVPLRHTPG